MNLFGVIRNYSLWFLYRYKIRSLNEKLNYLKLVNETFNVSEINIYQQKIILKLLKTVSLKVPFYKGLHKLSDCPIINKDTILKNYDDFIDRSQKDIAKKVSTSGSTGIPFKAYWGNEKVSKNKVDTLYYFNKVGYKPGDKIYYFRVWDETNKLSFSEKTLKNIVPIDISKLTFYKAVEVLKKIEDDSSNKIILGYASAIQSFYDLIYEQNKFFKGKVLGVITLAEGLSDTYRINISNFFNCQIMERYSNSENGLIAHRLSNMDTMYHINFSSYLVEIIDVNDDNPVDEGEIGRIIVTDLYNTAMPFIRYDTGDLGIFKYDSTGKMVLNSIEGRKLDVIFNSKGEFVSAHTIDYVVRNIQEVKQFQFIQEDINCYTLKLIITERRKDIEQYIIRNLKMHLGEDANIKIVYVDKIPLISSGKFKMVINNYQIKKQ